MKTFLIILTVLATLGTFSTLIFFGVFIVRAIRKRNWKRPGIIALANFTGLVVVSLAASLIDPVTRDRLGLDVREEYRDTQEQATDTDGSFVDGEITVSPKGGKKLKVMGTTLTFRIDAISRDSTGIQIPLLADGAIPLYGMKAPVGMKIMAGKQTLGSSETRMSGMIRDGALLGHLVFTFSTTRIPDAVIVSNNEGKSIRYEVKIND